MNYFYFSNDEEVVNLAEVRHISRGSISSRFRILVEYKIDVPALAIYYSTESEMAHDWNRLKVALYNRT